MSRLDLLHALKGKAVSSRFHSTLLATCCAVVLTSFAAPASANTGTLLGVYYGNQGWAMNDVHNMEAWQGKRHAVLTMFTNWCNQNQTLDNLFNQQLPAIWKNGNVPMITWQPFLCSSSSTPATIDVQIAAGQYDSYIGSWARRLKTFLSGPDTAYGTADDRRVYIRLAHEMNGNWYPWSASVGNSTPSDYIAMWRHVKAIFDRNGLDGTHVQWLWCANATDAGAYVAEQYYPGDTYVNWIAVDGYNWGTSQTWSAWQTASQVFGSMINRLRAISSRPLAITEVASTTSTSTGTSIATKSQWISDLFAYVTANNVKMLSWFNQDKETDWAVFGGSNGDNTYQAGSTAYRTFDAYRIGVASGAFMPSDPTNPRLLTDTQFMGM